MGPESVVALTALAISFLALGVSIYNLVETLAMQKSTHKVMMYDPFASTSEDLDLKTKARMVEDPIGKI